MSGSSSGSASNSMHKVYAVVLTVVAVIAFVALIAVLMRSSAADDTTADVTISNSTPVISDHSVAIVTGGADQATVTPTENATNTVYSNFLVTDDNGCGDVDSAASNLYDVAVYKTDATGGSSCSADDNDCYQGSDSNYTVGVAGYAGNSVNTCGASDADVSAEATTALTFYADPTGPSSANAATDWTSYVSLQDDNAAPENDSNTFEIAELLALNVTSSIDYGALSLNATSSEQTITVTNTGNAALDANIQATDFTCTTGTIPAGNAEWSLSTGFSYGAGTDLTGSDVNTDAVLAKPTSGTAVTDDVYTLIQTPTSGVGGTCQSTFTLTAIDDI